MADFDNLLWISIRLEENEKALEILRNLSNATHLVDSTGATLLHVAANSGNCEVAKYLIESGAEIDAQDSKGKTPLMLVSSSFYRTRIIDLLLDYNASIFMRDNDGQCAFQNVSPIARMTVLRKLSDVFSGDAEKIASEFLQWNCCVLFSLLLKNAELTRLLVARGCTLVCPECLGIEETVLERAVRNNDLENVKFFLDYGLDVNEESLGGNTALTALEPLILGGRQNPEILRLLLDRGANPSMILTRSRWCPGKMQMYTILKYCKRDIVRMVLDRNIDLYIQDANGCSAVHYMAENVQPNATEELLGRDYDVNARNDKGRTPLHYIHEAHLTNVNFLLDEGANVDAKDAQGVTPLMRVWRQKDPYYRDRYLVHPLPMKWENTKRQIECLLYRGADAQEFAPSEDYSLFANVEDDYGFYWIQPVLVHLALDVARGTPFYSAIKDKIYQYALTREYFEMCTRQLEEMKGVIVWKSISLHELLVARDAKIERYVRNGKLLSNLRCIKNKNEYIPYYTYVLRDRILKAVKVMSLRERIAAILYEVVGLGRISHHTIVDKITNYLSERDLRKLYCEK